MAHKALTTEDKIGTMLPCNVIVEEHDDGTVEVSAVDPLVTMEVVDNNNLKSIARQVKEMLAKVVASV